MKYKGTLALLENNSMPHHSAVDGKIVRRARAAQAAAISARRRALGRPITARACRLDGKQTRLFNVAAAQHVRMSRPGLAHAICRAGGDMRAVSRPAAIRGEVQAAGSAAGATAKLALKLISFADSPPEIVRRQLLQRHHGVGNARAHGVARLVVGISLRLDNRLASLERREIVMSRRNAPCPRARRLLAGRRRQGLLLKARESGCENIDDFHCEVAEM